jgi:gliding motility-associated-like protein
MWSPALNSGSGIFDPALDSEGVYTYTVLGPIECNQTDAATVTVTIVSNPDVSGMDLMAETICLGEDNIVSISNANLLIDGDYILTYELSGANTSTDTVNISVISGNSSFIIPSTQLLNFGDTIITIVQFITSITFCEADTTLIASVGFTMNESTTPTLVRNGNIFCSDENATIADLTSNILDDGEVNWYDSTIDGTVYSSSYVLADGETYYASLINENSCESIIRLEVIVSFEFCATDIIIPDGFSPNGDMVNDDFFIRNLRELFPKFTLEIFNRYGSVLYKGNINSPNWDGTATENSVGNSKAPTGVYFYILKFNDGDKNPIQGRVYLNR